MDTDTAWQQQRHVHNMHVSDRPAPSGGPDSHLAELICPSPPPNWIVVIANATSLGGAHLEGLAQCSRLISRVSSLEPPPTLSIGGCNAVAAVRAHWRIEPAHRK